MKNECPVCESPRCKPSYRMRDRFFETSNDEFLLYQCGSCGLLFQREEEVVNRLPGFYPPGYWWDGEGHASALEKKYREWMIQFDQLRFILSLFPQPQNHRLLDIGCGSGTFVKLAREAGFDACGLEQSEEAVRIAQGSQQGTIFRASVQDLVAGEEQFDILTLFHSFEHMTEPLKCLRDLQKLLRKPGKIVLQVPNTKSMQARIFGPRWYGLDCPRHLYNYSSFSLRHLLARAGYRIHRVRYFSLRDNAAALVSSLFPGLDPMSQRVKLKKKRGRSHSLGLTVKEVLYLSLLVLAQPLALMEAGVGQGATVTLYATVD